MNEYPCLIVVPARNEERSIVQTLQSIRLAIREAQQKAFVVVVCDDCTDQTANLSEAALFGVPSLVLTVAHGNVGLSRDYGVKVGLDFFPEAKWIAFTDADTSVEKDWLQRQIHAHHLKNDAYFGRVAFDETSEFLRRFAESYLTQTHKRIHGANMGLSVPSYYRVGGIPGLTAHEDRVLSERLEAQNLTIFWDESASVKTSVRLEGRAPEGFAATLNRFVQARDLAV